MPRFSPEARQANQALVERIGAIASRKGVTRAQIALAWVLAQQPWIVPIPGTTRLERLEENLAAAEVTLTREDIKSIDQMLAETPVQGARYPQQLQQLAGR